MSDYSPSPDVPARPLNDRVDGIDATSRDVVRFTSPSVPATAKAAFTPTFSPLGVLRALRRRQAVALAVAVVAIGIAFPAALFLVPQAKYKTQAKLQLVASPPKILFRTAETEATTDDYKRFQATQLTLVKSVLVLGAALGDKEKMAQYKLIKGEKDPIQWLNDNLKVEFVAGSEVMEISLSGEEPAELAGIVNAVKKAYMDEVVNVDAKRRSDRLQKLKKIKENYGELLKERRPRLKKNAETVGSDNRDTIALKQQYAMESLQALRRDLLAVKAQKRKLEIQLKARTPAETSAAPAASIAESDIDKWIDSQPIIVQLDGKLAKEEAQLEAHKALVRSANRRGSGDSLLKRLQDAVEKTQAALETKQKALRPIAIAALQEATTTNQVAQGNQDEQELAILTELEAQLNTEITVANKEMQSFNLNTLDLQELQDEVNQLTGTERQVAAEVEMLTVEVEAPARIKTIEDAPVPLTRDEKRRNIIIAMISLGSFFGGLFGVAFLELRHFKVDSAEEVPADFGLELVGTLPILRSNASRGRAAAPRDAEKDRYWHNILLESIDATRTMLLHAARSRSHRVVMIASAEQSEGKTSLATHLATSLARGGLRALLVDADLRSPSVHRLFDLPLTAGLSELLRGEVAAAEAIQGTDIEELKVVTAGSCDRQTIRRLAQGCIGPIFEQFKEQFDFVIVDSSPILPVADALLIAQQSDAALFSIFSDVSRKTKVFAAIARLQCLGVPILGAVVTGTRGATYGDAYYPDSDYGALPESTADSTGPTR
jgi:polysaccharide biosynthesis transport protein